MVKNITGGNKAKKGKRGGRLSKNPTTEFDTEDGLHFFGQVTGKVGGNTIDVLLQTGETVHATIPGRFKKRVWFNKDDLIVVRQEDKFYDVLQKITNPSTLLAASTALNIKIDKDHSNIFRADIVDEESDDEEEIKVDSKTKLLLERRKKDKERDIQRRGEENDDFDRVISVVTKEDMSETSSDERSTDSLGNKIEKKPVTQVKPQIVDDSSESESETESDSESDSSDSETDSDEKEITMSKPVPAKNTYSAKSFLKVKQEFKTPEKPTKPVEPNAPARPAQKKNIVYKETPDEVKRMMNLD